MNKMSFTCVCADKKEAIKEVFGKDIGGYIMSFMSQDIVPLYCEYRNYGSDYEEHVVHFEDTFCGDNFYLMTDFICPQSEMDHIMLGEGYNLKLNSNIHF